MLPVTTPQTSLPAISTVAELRAALPITAQCVYLQTASYAPIPEPTLDFQHVMAQEENHHALAFGLQAGASAFIERVHDARTRMARFLHVTPEEVAWTANTTSATRQAVRSFVWRPNDKLAVSDVEHASTYDLVDGMAAQLGVEVTVIPTGGDAYSPDTFLAELERRLTPDHRLLILCHVANTDGRRLPVAAAAALARSRDVPILIDGAQAIGALPVDVGAIDADFYTGSLHKWMMGPTGIGYLVVARRRLAGFDPDFQRATDRKYPVINAGGRTELGTANHIARLAAGFTVDLLEHIGLPKLEATMRDLTAHLRAGLAAIPGLRVIGPLSWEESSAITTIKLTGASPEQHTRLVERLRTHHRIIVKTRPEVNGIRLSVAAFNTATEIEAALAAFAAETYTAL